jgi:L-lactate dehydrogenase complex protein LldG
VSDREKFLADVSRLLGREKAIAPEPVEATGLATPKAEALAEAERVRAVMAEQADSLFDAAAASAEAKGWTVHRLEDLEKAARRVLRLCREKDVSAAVLSGHEALRRALIEWTLQDAGIHAKLLRGFKGENGNGAGGDPGTKPAAFSAGVGITGADYVIAETGTLVLHPRSGVSRLVSLAPPVHIAIVEKGQVLPSLDELFTLERAELLNGTLAGSMNLISGPSRTGDIEATIIKGIHGPVETHMLLVG